jgi:hypothetical protein
MNRRPGHRRRPLDLFTYLAGIFGSTAPCEGGAVITHSTILSCEKRTHATPSTPL